MTPDIVYEDGEALVINKPSGLPIEQPRAGGTSLDDHIEALKLGFRRAPAPVHRLDTDTSGCLLLARNPKALKRFARAFEDRKVEKLYFGVVAGELPEESGTISLALSKISSREKGWRMIPARNGKPSTTHWRKVGAVGAFTLLEFRPETGRTHQIRVHAAEGLGCGLVGDPIYGDNRQHAQRTLLHAARLTVPRDNKPAIAAAAPLPQTFQELGFG